ncbi:MAG: DNA double-strand break repair nuclease NurA [Candidatus Bathyarchaeota archaeon]|nr:DNA double-strand break repair nuclease NurA [Candidatus Bathyarchaeota archaeon]
MPVFLEDFARLIDSKKDYLRERILKGRFNPLEKDFKRFMLTYWIPLGDLSSFSVNLNDLKVIAVDSSVYTNLLPSGGVFYIIRSMAMLRNTVTAKKIDVDVIFSRDKVSKIQDLIIAKMEMLEFEVVLNALKDGFSGDAILIDGSLYGRASYPPLEPRVEEERDILLRYFKVYKDLLDFCRKSNILLAGVSKESRSTFYRDYLLYLIFSEELDELSISSEDKRLLWDIFFQMLYSEKVALEKFYRLRKKYGGELDAVETVLWELASSRPDYQLIMRCVSSVGYAYPLLLGPTVKMAKRLKEYREDPEGYVKKYFPRLSMEKGGDFIQSASEVLRGILEFPSFISFYILLDLRDSPIRIDIPCYDKTLLEVSWPEPIEADIKDLLKIMVTGYCGLNVHNIWLKNVDEKVKLRRKVVDEIYLPFLEKMFGEKIIHGRGYRRVKYP